MDNGKANVLNLIAKQGVKPFSASMITAEAGLSRQLVHYHLTHFMERGWLEKTAKYYTVIDVGSIIDELTESANTDDGTKKPSAKGLVSASTGKGLTDTAMSVVFAKALDLPESRDMKAHMNGQIDETIAFFRSLKRYLNNAQPSVRTAAKHFATNTSLYDTMVSDSVRYEPNISRSEWVASVAEGVEGVLDAKASA